MERPKINDFFTDIDKADSQYRQSPELFNYTQSLDNYIDYLEQSKQGETREDQIEKIIDTLENVLDKHTSPTGGGYEADCTSCNDVVKDMREYLKLNPPTKVS